MTLRAISIGLNSYQNLVETDRALVDTLAHGVPGVILSPGSTMAAITDLQVSPGTGHTINVGAGKAILREKTNPVARGAYFFQADAIEASVALPVPDTQPFYTAIVARVTDPQYGTVTGNVGARIDTIKGTPAASPAVVSDSTIDAVTNTPGGWIRLADVRINVTDTGAIPSGQITDTRKPGGFGTINCLRVNRPVGTGRISVYEMDTKMERTWDGTRWQWVGGAKQIRAITLPSVTPPLTTNWTFPVVAGSGIAAQTNDPDSAMSINTVPGTQGIKCEVPGIYRATGVFISSVNSADAVVWITPTGGETTYGAGTFGKNGATFITTQTVIANAGDVFIPTLYVYSGSSVSFNGKFYVELVSER